MEKVGILMHQEVERHFEDYLTIFYLFRYLAAIPSASLPGEGTTVAITGTAISFTFDMDSLLYECNSNISLRHIYFVDKQVKWLLRFLNL